MSGTHENSSQFVYALGQVIPRFPLISLEKEYLQATGLSDTAGLTDRETLYKVLSDRRNRYLARQMCWVLSIEETDVYLIQPRSPEDLDMVIEAIRPRPLKLDIDLVIGHVQGMASPQTCNGMLLNIVAFDQIYSFDAESLIDSIPKAADMPEDRFAVAARELFDRISQLADNTGRDDGHRALNYLLVRYANIYHLVARKFNENYTLATVATKLSPLAQNRKIIEVIFHFMERKTEISDKYFVRVDVTEEFPFLASKILPYFDR